MNMKKLTVMVLTAAMAFVTVVAQDAKPKKRMPSSPMMFRQLKAATKAATRYEAPIFVAVVAKGSAQEKSVKKLINHKFFKELAKKGFFIYMLSVPLHKKEFEADGKTPRAMYEKLKEDDRAMLDIIFPSDQLRRLPRTGMISHDAKEAKIKPVDMPRLPSPDAEYFGGYLQNLQSAAQAYGIDIEMSKEMRKYIENPPPKK